MSGAGLKIAAVASLAALSAGCTGLYGFPNPPTYAEVLQPVLVSADGKTITSFGVKECGRHPALVAGSFPRKVTLRWFNPDTNCNAEPLGLAVGRTILRAPLGGRNLVQADSGTAIPYFSERDLADVRALPHGFGLTSDLPSENFPEMAGPQTGDTRTYTVPRSTARLSITQIVEKGSHPLGTWPWPIRLRVAGRPGAMIIDRAQGRVDARSITWAVHGYRFIVTSVAPGQHQRPLSTAELAAIASGLALQPGQYR